MEAVPKKPAIKKHVTVKPHAARKPRAIKPHITKHSTEPKHEPKHIVETAVTSEEVKPAVTKIAHPPAGRAGGKSFYAVGRRKTAVAQATITEGNGTITINRIPFIKYFQTLDLQFIATQPLVSIGLEKQFNIRAKIHGGGIHAQAEAMRHALGRCLIAFNPESRRTLKKLGFLKRDPRVKERKKPGLKRARRAPQFSKR